ANLEEVSKTLIYFAHPYTSCDKGTVERHNGLIRRFIPKGDCINNYSLQQIIDIETWCNSLPRKILAYHTPDEIFERELDTIYQCNLRFYNKTNFTKFILVSRYFTIKVICYILSNF